MTIPETTRQGLYRYLGDKTDNFLSNTNIRLEKYTDMWQLTNISFMPTDTVNLLFSCDSGLYGSCVLKMCIPGLPQIPWDGQIQYPTYLLWMKDVRQDLIKKGDQEDMLFYLDKAMAIYLELRQRYTQTCLLHGDMHQENMLLNLQGSYTIIDPKGVVDAPIMDIARFLNNEGPSDAKNETKIREMIAILSSMTNFSESDLFKCMFIDFVLMMSWCVNDHYPTQDAFQKAMQEAQDECKTVYGLVNS